MEKSVYDCTTKGSKLVDGISVDLYSFKCEFNHTYIVEVEKHTNNIYLFQYYLKSHTESENKYSLRTPLESKKGKTGVRNFLIILNTIQKLMFSYLSRNPLSSFGFVGASSINYNKVREILTTKSIEQENEDGTFSNTQRFRIYTTYLKRSFSSTYFYHVEIKSISSYLLLNKKSNLVPEDCFNFFLDYLG